MIDATDRSILALLQDNARVSNSEIARQIGMAPSAVLERIRKLEARGVIRGYEVRVNPEAVGAQLLAYVLVRTDEPTAECTTGLELAQLPEVLEVHHVAGEDRYLAKVRTSSTTALGRLLREKVGSISTVVGTKTTIVLDSHKESSRLPLGGEEGCDD
jgi:Lrp/AsnC family leucine-responsive transcriptional regulator